MIKRLIAILMLLCLVTGSALAQSAPAALALNKATLEQLGGTQTDEAGRWRIIAPEAQAALDRIASGSMRTPVYTQAYFYVQADVDIQTSRIQPSLVFLLFGQTNIGAGAVSIALDDQIRYDLPVASQAVEFGSLKATALYAPLDAEGIDMLYALLDAKTITLRFYGQTAATLSVSWEDTVRRTGTNRPDWSDILRASLDGIDPMLHRLEALGMMNYDLWLYNAAAWDAAYGFEPQVDIVAGDSGVMDMWLPDDRDDAISTLQTRLAEHHLYYGSISGTYNALTSQAVARLQALEGLVVTGAADQQVLDALNTFDAFASVPAAQADATDDASALALGDLATLSIERYWYTRSIRPTNASQDDVLSVSVQNQDNLLLAIDGQIQNLSMETFDLYWQLAATIVYDDQYTFTCTVQRERDLGTHFDTLLPPLESARLVISAELPPAVIDSDKPLRLEIKLNNEALEYPLR